MNIYIYIVDRSEVKWEREIICLFFFLDTGQHFMNVVIRNDFRS